MIKQVEFFRLLRGFRLSMWRNARCRVVVVFVAVGSPQISVEDRSFRGTLETTVI